MRVKREVLAPCVQHCHSPGFNAKMRVSERAERLPYGSKKQVVIHPVIVQAYRIQLVRYGKDDVVMFHGQGISYQVVDPESLPGSLSDLD